MPENGHLNGPQAGGGKGYFWTLKMEFPRFPDFGLCRGRGGSQRYSTPPCRNYYINIRREWFYLVFRRIGWCKTGLSKQGYGSYVVHAWCTLRSCVLVPWYSGWIYIAVNDNLGYSMSLVCSWNEVGDVLCVVPSSPFCTYPFWQMPIYVMAGTSLHRFYVMRLYILCPWMSLCNGQPHQSHTHKIPTFQVWCHDAQWITWNLCNEPKINSTRVF